MRVGAGGGRRARTGRPTPSTRPRRNMSTSERAARERQRRTPVHQPECPPPGPRAGRRRRHAVAASGPKGRVVQRGRPCDAEAAPLRRTGPAAQPAPAGSPAGRGGAPAAAAPAPAAACARTAGPRSRTAGSARSSRGGCRSPRTTAPHFYLRISARVDALLALRAQLNASGRARVSVNDFIVKAAAPGADGRAGDERRVDRRRGAPGPDRRRRRRGGQRQGPGHPGDPGRRLDVALRALGEDQGRGRPARTRASCRRPTCRAAR